jgi:hypothetical protein
MFTTDGAGAYLMPAMPVGVYTVAAELTGFSPARQAGVVLTVNQNVRVDLTMSVGAIAQSVEVQGNVTAVDTRQASLTHLVEQKRLIELPLNGRNPASLIALIPGVAGLSVPTRPGISGVIVRINGTNAYHQQFLLDGAPFNAVQRSDGLPLPPPDVVQEFRVTTNAYSAEYGRNAGGIFSTITKSGTNELHAALWEYLRNDKLNARSFFAPSIPTLRQNQFGFTAGGPVYLPRIYNGNNKTFFFASFQGLRVREVALRNNAVPPTEAERQGDFSRARVLPRDPLNNSQPFPGGLIPSPRFDPAAVKILGKLPLANLPDGRWEKLASSPTDSNQYMFKLDQQIGRSNTLSLKYWQDTGDILDPWPFNANLPWSPGVFLLDIRNGSLNDTHVFSPTLINQARYAYTLRNEDRFNTVREDIRSLGIAIAPPAQPFLPTVTATGRFILGVQINGQPTKLDNTWSFYDTLTWTKGSHTIKTGFSIEAPLFEGVPQFDNGTFTFSGQITGDVLADLLIGRPVSFSQNIGRKDNHVTKYWGGFLQDDWRLGKRVTLNMGLRYQYDSPMTHRLDKQGNFLRGVQSQRYPTAPVGMVYPGDAGLPRSLYRPDRNNWAPRFGIAFDPKGDGRTSIRAGYGLFYQIVSVEVANFLGANPPFATNASLNPPFSLSDPWRGRFRGGVDDPVTTFDPSPNRAVFAVPLVVRPVDANIRNGYIQQYSLSVQRQLPAEILFELAYVGNSARKMTTVRQFNPAVPSPGATLANTEQRRRILPGIYAGMNYMESSTNSHYNGLQASLNKRFSRNYLFTFAYTWSKTIDFNSSESLGGGFMDPNDQRRERGPAGFDLRHNASGSLVWEPPYLLKNSNPVVRYALGGWSIAGLFTARTGGPISPVVGRDNSLTAVGLDRPNVTSDPALSTSRPRNEQIARWFDTAAFQAPAMGTFGNLGRNALRGPGAYNIDVNLSKNFRLREAHHIQFRAEFFNLFNHATLGNPDVTYFSANFGRILSTGGPRLIQLALRYSF